MYIYSVQYAIKIYIYNKKSIEWTGWIHPSYHTIIFCFVLIEGTAKIDSFNIYLKYDKI